MSRPVIEVRGIVNRFGAQVVHPEGKVDPLADVETIETELLYADLEQAERRLERVAKQAKAGDKELIAEERWLSSVVEALREGRTVRSVPEPELAPGAATRLSALTSKPVLFVANVAEGDPVEPPDALVEHARTHEARARIKTRHPKQQREWVDDQSEQQHSGGNREHREQRDAKAAQNHERPAPPVQQRY